MGTWYHKAWQWRYLKLKNNTMGTFTLGCHYIGMWWLPYFMWYTYFHAWSLELENDSWKALKMSLSVTVLGDCVGQHSFSTWNGSQWVFTKQQKWSLLNYVKLLDTYVTIVQCLWCKCGMTAHCMSFQILKQSYLTCD